MGKFILLVVIFIVNCAKPVKTVDTYENYLKDLSNYKVIQSSKVVIRWDKARRLDELEILEIAVLEGKDGNRYLKFDYPLSYVSGGYILCNLTKFQKDIETTGRGSCIAIEGNSKGYAYFKMEYSRYMTVVNRNQKGYSLSMIIGIGYYPSKYKENKDEIMHILIGSNFNYISKPKLLGLFGLQYREGKLRVIVPITETEVKTKEGALYTYTIGKAMLTGLRFEYTKQGVRLHANYTDYVTPVTIMGKGLELQTVTTGDSEIIKKRTIILGGDWIDLTPYIPIQKAP